MAKKFDPLTSLPKSERFSRPEINTRHASKVMKKSKTKPDAKGRYPKQIRLPPELVDEIEDIIAKNGYSKMDFWHWLVAVGLDEYRQGDRPETVKEVRQTINI
jgi:hypothetical protein